MCLVNSGYSEEVRVAGHSEPSCLISSKVREVMGPRGAPQGLGLLLCVRWKAVVGL